MAEKRDYYDILGLDKSAGESDIKKAYRTLAKKYHPDVNPGDKSAEAKFKEINEAYAVLSDSDKKAKYDQYGHAAFDPASGSGGSGFGFAGFDFSDIFSAFSGGFSSGRRGGPVQGDDIALRVTISFEEAAFGCKKDISFNKIQKCSDCDGSGAAKGTKPVTCAKCRGSGQVRVSQQMMGMSFQSTATCSACNGSGKTIKDPCGGCRGTGYVKITRKLNVSIPAGIDNGERVALRGEGNDGRGGGEAGDLIIIINMKPHPIFTRSGYNLYCEVPLTIAEATLGAEIEVPTLEENIKYTIPEGTQQHTRFELRGYGVQMVNSKNRGNLIFTVSIEIPKGLNENQKEIMRKFAESCGENNYSSGRTNFFKRIFNK